MSAPAPNLEQAAAFLRLLDPEAERFTFQTFDDTPRKSDSLAKIYHGSLDELSGSLAKLQGSGAGVFVTVNETDLQGRKTTNVKRVRAVFADLDGAPLAPVLACPLEPHIVVESSPEKFHAYWLVEDLPLEAFEPVQRAIAARFGGDPQVNDLPRVMRLPGFLHQKGAPAYSCISHVNERLPYHVSEILAEFPPASRSDPIGNGRDHEAEAMADLVRQILTGEHYHAPLCALAWRHINAGMPGGQVVETLRGLMHASTGPRDARWNAHYAEIPRTVGTAQDKLEAGRPQVEFTFLKGDQERASDDQERASDDQGQAPGNEQPDPQPKARIINLRDFGATRFAGPPPQIRWLVKDSIPLGVPVLLAAMGGIGKSFLSLQLCHGIATPPAESGPGAIDLNVQWPILGGSIAEHGKAVLITAEDSDAVIHRRLAVVDPYGRRTNDLMIVALPSAGGPMPLFVQDRNGVRTTADWHMIRDQLLSIEGLRLIAIDPLAAFAQVLWTWTRPRRSS